MPETAASPAPTAPARPPPRGDRRASAAPWQVGVREVPAGPWDAIVVGAGPSGSTAAIALAGRGHRVLLLDRSRFPRDKACGDGLIPDSIATLRRIGVHDQVRSAAHPVRSATVYSPSRIRFELPGEFLVLPRVRLDSILAYAAHRRGAVVAEGRVEEVGVEGDGTPVIRVVGGIEPLRARIVVLATGADVSLLDRLGMVARTRPSAVALRAYVRSEKRLDSLVFSFDHRILPGYGWVFPLGDGRFNVGVGVFARNGALESTDLRATFDAFLDGFPPARELLEAGEVASRLRGARLRCGLDGARMRGPGNVLAIGETIGATFPLTGEGIGKAMESAEIAADVADRALREARMAHLDEYPRRLAAELRPRYLGYRIAERWLSHRWVGDLIARRIRRSRFLREAAAGIVAESVDPREVFSVRGVVRSLWR